MSSRYTKTASPLGIGREIRPEDEELIIQPGQLDVVFADYWRMHGVRNPFCEPRRPDDRRATSARFLRPRANSGSGSPNSGEVERFVERGTGPRRQGIRQIPGQHRSRGDTKLFRLIFRFLAAKVLHDRGIPGFDSLTPATDSSVILGRAESYYGRSDAILDNQAVRDAVKSAIWGRLNLQNLSVEVLAYIYEFTLVSHSLRKRLGIHGTPPSIRATSYATCRSSASHLMKGCLWSHALGMQYSWWQPSNACVNSCRQKWICGATSVFRPHAPRL